MILVIQPYVLLRREYSAPSLEFPVPAVGPVAAAPTGEQTGSLCRLGARCPAAKPSIMVPPWSDFGGTCRLAASCLEVV